MNPNTVKPFCRASMCTAHFLLRCTYVNMWTSLSSKKISVAAERPEPLYARLLLGKSYQTTRNPTLAYKIPGFKWFKEAWCKLRAITRAPLSGNVLQICMPDYALLIWQGKMLTPDQTCSVITGYVSCNAQQISAGRKFYSNSFFFHAFQKTNSFIPEGGWGGRAQAVWEGHWMSGETFERGLVKEL